MNETNLPRKQGITGRMAAMFIVVFCFSLLLNAFLDYSNFKRNHTEIERSRFSVVLGDLRDTLEYAEHLGMSLREFPQLQNLAENTTKRYPEITRICVVDAKGVSLFDTQKETMHKMIEEKWVAKASTSRQPWHDGNQTAHIVGAPIINSINMVSASLVLFYSQDNLTKKLVSVRNELAKVTLALMVVFSALIFFGLRWINRQFERKFQSMEQAIIHENAAHYPDQDQGDIQSFIAETKTLYSNLDSLEKEIRAREEQTK